MRLEGFGACIDLVQHERVSFLLWHEYLELQGAGLGCQAALGMSLQVLQVFVPLARTVLIVATIASLLICLLPYEVLTGSRRLLPIGRPKCSTAQFCRTSSLFSGVFDPSFPRGFRNRLLALCQAHGSIQMEQRRTARVEAGLRQGQRSAVARPPHHRPIMKVRNEEHRAT